jgi:hypothetical protein
VVLCGGEISEYIEQPNFHRWEMPEALPHTRYSGKVLWCAVGHN